MVESMQKRVSVMSNWKTQDQMPYKGFWFKKLTTMHDRVAKHSQSLFKYWYCTNMGDKGYNTINNEGHKERWSSK